MVQVIKQMNDEGLLRLMGRLNGEPVDYRGLPRHIYFRANRYEVTRTEGKRLRYLGRYKTLSEAQEALLVSQ